MAERLVSTCSGPSTATERRGITARTPFTFIDGVIKVIWGVIKIMVPFWVPIIIRPLIFRVPKQGP